MRPALVDKIKGLKNSAQTKGARGMGGKEATSVTWNELIKDAPDARVSRTELFTKYLHKLLTSPLKARVCDNVK